MLFGIGVVYLFLYFSTNSSFFCMKNPESHNGLENRLLAELLNDWNNKTYGLNRDDRNGIWFST